MSAHHGPPCGHTTLGLCSQCGGPPTSRINAAEQTFAMTNGTRTYGPVTVTAEAMAEAQRQLEALKRLREQTDAAQRRWMYAPSVFLEPLKVKYEPEMAGHVEARMRYLMTPIKGGSYGLASGEALDPGPEFQRKYLGEWKDPAPPVDPLDVVYDGSTLRKLLNWDEAVRREDGWTRECPGRGFTPAQRAAVSAHWSAQLRAKVAAGAAADKARETSVVVDLEDW